MTIVSLYLLAILIPLLSVMRSPIVVYLQLFLILGLAILAKTKLLSIGPIFLGIYGNFFAPMDNEARFGGTFPSIHTMEIISSVKGIDILLVIVFFLLIKYRSDYQPIKVRRGSLALLTLFLGNMAATSACYQIWHPGTFDFAAMLYCARGILFAFGLYGLCRVLDRVSLVCIMRTSILCCIALMAFAILVPNENSMHRELLGIPLTVAFAGDEYASLGLMFAACLLTGGLSKRNMRFIALVALSLALIAGRKASLPYFFFVFVLLGLHGRRNSSYLSVLLLSSEFFAPWIALTVLSGVENIYIQLAFNESFGILNPTLSSLGRLFSGNPMYALFGIGPFSKYPLFGLSPLFDHPFAFGAQAGDLYKIKLWFLPFDRLVLNAGLIGVVAVFAILYRIRKFPPAIIYIFLYSMPFFSLNLQSTVMIASLTIAWAAIKERNPLEGLQA